VEFASTKLADPPPMVVLKRKAIRQFPGGQRIALYRNDMLNLDVSVPYTPGQVGVQQSSISYAAMKEDANDELSLELSESIVQSLRAIMKKGEAGTVVFSNGATATVQPATAKNIVDLHGKVNQKNKQNLRQMGDSPQDFKKVVDFTTTI